MSQQDRHDRQWQALAELPDQNLPLLDGALFVARDEYPELDIGRVAADVHAIAHGILERLQPSDGLEPRLAMTHQRLFEELGFRGNREDYYDPRNSFINDVLTRRCGIPISLSLLYLEVGRLVGLPVAGVALPGHFVVRLQAEPARLLDPFNGGSAVQLGDIQAGMSALGSEGSQDRLQALLTPATPREILVRMLRNLKAIYLAAGDSSRCLRTCHRLVTLLPDQALEYRDRGTLYLEMDAPARALADYRRYLALAPDCDDRAAIEAQVERLRFRKPTLH